MTEEVQAYRLIAATGTHRGDRAYQQDQVQIFAHRRVSGCVLGLVADGMGGKSGGRKASDQTVMTAEQLFERFVPSRDDGAALLAKIIVDAHLMIKLTAITSEEEPHSTVAAFLIGNDRRCDIVHAGDSRIYHFRGPAMVSRTVDHSFVQKLVAQGKIQASEADSHPQANLLTGCLGTPQDPPIALGQIDRLEVGDTVMACSDGLWHYFTEQELGAIVHTLPPRQASEMLISKARTRARGAGDNLSLALVRVEPLAP